MTKEEKIETIAENWTDECGTYELQQYFYEGQIDYLESLDEEQLSKVFEEHKHLLGN